MLGFERRRLFLVSKSHKTFLYVGTTNIKSHEHRKTGLAKSMVGKEWGVGRKLMRQN